MRIRSEADAWEFLIKCRQDPLFGNDGPLTYENCALTIRLDPGDGQADWKAARAVSLLQHHLNLTYLLAKRGNISGRLTDREREQLGIGFRVAPGSTTLILETANALRAIQRVLPAHWSMRARNLVAVGVFLGTVTYGLAPHYASYRANVDAAHIAAGASVEIAERTNRTNLEIAKVHADAQIVVAKINVAPSLLEAASPSRLRIDGALILASLAHDDTSNVVSFAISDYVPWRPAFMGLAPYGGTLQWNDSKAIPAAVAKAIAKKTRGDATEQKRIAKQKGRTPVIDTPWVTEVLHTHDAPGAMRLGLSST